MIKNICTVILLLLSVLPAAGQNRVKVKISGNVITTDGAPAEYITVSLKNTVFRTFPQVTFSVQTLRMEQSLERKHRNTWTKDC